MVHPSHKKSGLDPSNYEPQTLTVGFLCYIAKTLAKRVNRVSAHAKLQESAVDLRKLVQDFPHMCKVWHMLKKRRRGLLQQPIAFARGQE